MKSHWLSMGVAMVLSAVMTSVVGCSAQPDNAGKAGSESAVGTVSLPLVTPVQTTYRLHGATFAITNQAGTQVASVDSDTDPDADELTVSLPQGNYSVKLKNGWALDSVAADGTETPVQAALISQNPQSFAIQTGVDTAVTFMFTTDAGVIVIGTGNVNVSVGVTPNTGLSACDPLSSSYTCPSGQTCLLGDATSTRGFCAVPGNLPVGSPCSAEQCVAGAQCLSTDPQNPTQSTCTQFCNVTQAPFGCNCVSLGFNNSNLGICGATPAGTCDLLTQTGCAAGEACQYPGGSFGTCGAPGTTPNYASCSGETCLAGSSCYYGTCRPICDARTPWGNPGCSYCYSVGTGNAGRCSY